MAESLFSDPSTLLVTLQYSLFGSSCLWRALGSYSKKRRYRTKSRSMAIQQEQQEPARGGRPPDSDEVISKPVVLWSFAQRCNSMESSPKRESIVMYLWKCWTVVTSSHPIPIFQWAGPCRIPKHERQTRVVCSTSQALTWHIAPSFSHVKIRRQECEPTLHLLVTPDVLSPIMSFLPRLYVAWKAWSFPRVFVEPWLPLHLLPSQCAPIVCCQWWTKCQLQAYSKLFDVVHWVNTHGSIGDARMIVGSHASPEWRTCVDCSGPRTVTRHMQVSFLRDMVCDLFVRCEHVVVGVRTSITLVCTACALGRHWRTQHGETCATKQCSRTRFSRIFLNKTNVLRGSSPESFKKTFFND